MKIEIEEKICIRLGQYAAKHGLDSLSEAIGRLLDNQQGVGNSSSDKAVSRRDKYRRFVRGKVDISATVDVYVNALDYLHQNHEVNVWGMRNIEEVRRVYKSLLKGGNLHQPNRAYNNRAMSAAVGKYVDFLENENSG